MLVFRFAMVFKYLSHDNISGFPKLIAVSFTRIRNKRGLENITCLRKGIQYSNILFFSNTAFKSRLSLFHQGTGTWYRPKQ